MNELLNELQKVVVHSIINVQITHIEIIEQGIINSIIYASFAVTFINHNCSNIYVVLKSNVFILVYIYNIYVYTRGKKLLFRTTSFSKICFIHYLLSRFGGGGKSFKTETNISLLFF